MRKQLVQVVLIVVFGFLAYSNTFSNPLFLFDGRRQIVDNPVIKELKNFTSERTGYDYNPRRFVGYLSFALNYHFGGADSTGYHVVNLLIHIANALFLYFFVLLTFRTPSMRQSAESSPPPTSSPIALFSAILYVSHPLQTQAVTYIVQRFASLATFFYLLSLVMYVRGRLVTEKQEEMEGSMASLPSLLFFLASFISAVCAMKTKEIAFTLPLVILLYEIVFFRSSAKKMLFFLLPVLLTLLIVPLSLLHSDKPLGEMLSDLSEKTHVQTQMPRWDYLMTEMRVIVTYIRLIFLPIQQNLDYDYPIYHSFFTLPVFVSFILLSSIFGAAVYLLYKSRKAVSSQRAVGHESRSFGHSLSAIQYSQLAAFGILWFFITLSVESSVIPIVDVIYEHRLYLPLVGALMAITTGVFVAAKRLKIEKFVVPVLVFVTLLFSGLTHARNNVWNDEISLWQDVVAKSPNKARPHYNLGVAYASQGQRDKAIGEYQIAVQLSPDYVMAHNNLGVAYASQGKWDMAIAEYKAALRVKSDYADAHNNLGVAYASRGQRDRAIAEYQTALRLRPDDAGTHINLGIEYASRGQRDRAVAEYQTALRLKPDFAEAHYNLGRVYASQGEWDMAIAEYGAALRLKPNYLKAHYNLGRVYASQGKWDMSIAEYKAALRLKPNFNEARQRLNDIFTMRHQQGE